MWPHADPIRLVDEPGQPHRVIVHCPRCRREHAYLAPRWIHGSLGIRPCELDPGKVLAVGRIPGTSSGKETNT